MYRENSREAEVGRRGEGYVRRWLSQQGYFVIPVSDSGSAAAMMQRLSEKVVLPDIQAMKDGKCRWVEVKTKQTWVKYQKTGRDRTGCSLPNWECYLKVQSESGLEGSIAFLHLNQSTLLLDTIDWLDGHCQKVDGCRMGSDREGMVFFDCDRFRNAYLLQQNELTSLRQVGAPPKTSHPWNKVASHTIQQQGYMF